MDVKIFQGKVMGEISAPPSKSFTHRAIILAGLARGNSIVDKILISDDTLTTIAALKHLGVKIRLSGHKLSICGTSGKLHINKKNNLINCNESGTALRLITAVATLADNEVIIDGNKNLRQRPISELVKALKLSGIGIEIHNNRELLPLRIMPGKLFGGDMDISGKNSSQFASALLLIAPFAVRGLFLTVNNLRSAPYIDITMDMMKRFGVLVEKRNNIFHIRSNQRYNCCNYQVEGDFSSASYFMAAAAVTCSKIAINNLNQKSIQGDKRFLDILKKMGSKVEKSSEKIIVQGKNLCAINVDMANYPDIVPTVCVLAAFAKGKSVIRNIAHLKWKESDRIKVLGKELGKMGVKITSKNDSMTINGGYVYGAIVETHHDHRIAMSLAIAALGAKGETVIRDAKVINKSYPDFFDDFRKIGAKIKVFI